MLGTSCKEQSIAGFRANRRSIAHHRSLQPLDFDSPGVQIAVPGDGRRVVRSAGHLRHDLARQRPRDPGDVLPAVVPVPEATVVPPSPGVDLPLGRQNDGVAGPTSDLPNTDSTESVHVGRLVLVGGVPEA